MENEWASQQEPLSCPADQTSKAYQENYQKDQRAAKNTLRRLRRPFNQKPPKSTMKVRELQRLAQECGATPVECPALFLIGSGHRYALMVKDKV